ncbi:hypothetical protein [Bifidobacterium sp.]|jgi:hypothetical protein|uniref:hypothetical protein n=1 Tax=Bifidobacterium sp. TaxID=41200 RepID=UPI0025BEC49A|nr:hypothetical protein [Bifidobacterium sp.]MCI1634762.1 hypothetical protein [Bifidobacterium sp.]
MNDSHTVDNGQPSLMFPVISTDDNAPSAASNAAEDEQLIFAQQDAAVGDVVDTNWDIPKIDFTEHQPLRVNPVPLPPAFPPAHTDQVRTTPTSNSVWDAKLDLDPAEDSAVQPVAPLFAPTVTPEERNLTAATPQEDAVPRSLPRRSVQEDQEFLSILTGADADEQQVAAAPRRRSHTNTEEPATKGILWYIGCGALLGVVVVAAVILVASLLQ